MLNRYLELNALRKEYEKKGFSFIVLSGRKRVGKTTLIKEFCKDKDYRYMMSLENSAEENLRELSTVLICDKDVSGSMSFDGYNTALNYLTSQLNEGKKILVIDEYPYLANSYSTISSLLQKFIDHEWVDQNLCLILCGFSMSFMENQVLGYQSPLYGRRTMQMKVQPFSYLETAAMFPSFSNEDKAILYSITGGISEYLSRIDPNEFLKDTIISLFLNKGGRLYEEPSNLMKQELRDPSRYNAIVKAIANGVSRLNDISLKTGMQTSVCSIYIDNLISLGIVEKQRPANEATSKKTIYRVCDSMFRFWYTFVLPNISLLELEFAQEVYKHKVEPQLSTYMGYAFEDICIQYLKEEMKLGHIDLYPQMGKWWGNNPVKKREEEIDIMFADEGKLLLGECKWWTKKVDSEVLYELLEKGKMFPQEKKYYLFAKNGYSEQCYKDAVEYGVRLLTLDDIYYEK